jgi:hypothetical protein
MADDNKIAPLEDFPIIKDKVAEEFLGSSIDNYSDLELKEETKECLSRLLTGAKAGVVALSPLVCRGPAQCPFRRKCPIYQAEGVNGKYPVERQCIVEASYIRDKYLEYLNQFEFNENEVANSPTIRALVSKLSELDMYDIRLSLILAGATGHDGSLLIEQNIGAIPDTEEIITQLQEHPACKIKERIQKQRMEILDVMEATPKAKTRHDSILKISNNANYMQRQKALLEALDELSKKDL